MVEKLRKVAIIDIGTNTINLLIGDTDFTTYNFVESHKVPAKLGKGGIHNNIISKEAFQRGIKALEHHASIIADNKIENCIALATESLRGKENAHFFLEKANEILPSPVQIIDGQTEAFLIETAIKEQFNLSSGNFLLMDIGGGSVEFIGYKSGEKVFSESFKLGVSLLLQKLEISDILSDENFRSIEDVMKPSLELINEHFENNIPVQLIGSAGSFETFGALLNSNDNITSKAFLELAKRLYALNYEEKLALQGMPEYRAEYIHMGAALVHVLIKNFNITSLKISLHSMKEGALITYHKNKGLWPKF